MKHQVLVMLDNCVPTPKILSMIQNPLLVSKDIENMRSERRRDELQGRSPIEALVHRLEKEDNEKQCDYQWEIDQFKEAFPTIQPRVFITDKEDALINAIEDQYPDARRLLCGWHIKKNLTAHHKRSFTQEAWKQFIKEWEQLFGTCDEEGFGAGW
ncbi:hypothetical protein PsorP6_012473 [Peronosclerospora sorghi]|uniref:Uncharacterized protein n=1 Tax=Peronosclerospora sorghi TaxID=230839 RepID=A0ACC0WF30_9STRA|nr:hypothetical protein PsorP6_012473 [Peronosclerospora sorghi]